MQFFPNTKLAHWGSINSEGHSGRPGTLERLDLQTDIDDRCSSTPLNDFVTRDKWRRSAGIRCPNIYVCEVWHVNVTRRKERRRCYFEKTIKWQVEQHGQFACVPFSPSACRFLFCYGIIAFGRSLGSRCPFLWHGGHVRLSIGCGRIEGAGVVRHVVTMVS